MRFLPGWSLLAVALAVVPLRAAEPPSPSPSELIEEARNLRRQGQLAAMELKLRQAVSLARGSGDRKGEADARSALLELFDFERIEALAQGRLALALYRELGDLQGEATVLRGMSAIFAGAGFSSQALMLLPRVLEIEKGLGRSDRQADIHALLGAARQTEGSFEEALAHFEQALPASQTGEPIERVGALVRLANLQFALGRFEDALPRLEEAVSLLQREEPPDPAGELQRHLARLAAVMRDDVDPFAGTPEPELAPLLEDEALLREKLAVVAEEIEERSRFQALLAKEASPRKEDERHVSRTRFIEELGLREARDLRKSWSSRMISETGKTLREAEVPDWNLDLWSYTFSDKLEEEAARFNQELLDSGQVRALPPSWFEEQAAGVSDILRRHGMSLVIPAATLALRLSQRLPAEAPPSPAPAESARPSDSELAREIRLYLADPRHAPSPQLRDMLEALGPAGASFKIQNLFRVLLPMADSANLDKRAYLRAHQRCSCELAAYDLLGLTYAALGRPDKAAPVFERAWSSYLALVFPPPLPGETSSFREAAIEERRALQKRGFPAPLSRGSNCLGSGTAAAYLPLATPAHDTLWEGDVALSRGLLDEALFRYRDALSAGDIDARAAALSGMGTVYERQGSKALALKSYAAAMESLELMQANLRVETLAVPFVERRIPFYEQDLSLLADLGQTELAFEDAERARARSFLNQIGNRRLRLRQAPAELAGAWDEVRRRLWELASRFQKVRSEEARQGLAVEQDAARSAYVALRDRIRRLDPEYAAFTGIDTVTLHQVQTEVLEPGMTLVEYFVLEDRTLAWVIDRDQSQMVQLRVGRQALRERILYFLGLVAAHRPAEEVSAQLRRDLLGPLETRIRQRDLVIVPHGPLHELPFAALWNPATQRYLIQEYPISLAPSASVLRFVLGRRNPFEGRVLVLGNPDGSLPDAAREARAVAKLHGGEPLLGDQAREAAVRARAARVDILHLAAHARYDSTHPLFTSIDLASGGGAGSTDERADGRLYLHEIYDLDLGEANLVVLSACRTSLGKRSAGDEIVSLGRAFLYAGAPAVVTSLWPVDDAATAALMESFHRHLRAGLATAAALQTAQIEMLGRQEWRHPAFWAAFTLTGDPRRWQRNVWPECGVGVEWEPPL